MTGVCSHIQVGIKGLVSSVSLNNFGRQICPWLFVTLTNDVALLSAVSNLTSADVTLDTAGRLFIIGGVDRGVPRSHVDYEK